MTPSRGPRRAVQVSVQTCTKVPGGTAVNVVDRVTRSVK